MKIMIAVDDSQHSRRAVEFVTRTRWPAGSRMIVVSVVVAFPTGAFVESGAAVDAGFTATLVPLAQAAIERAEGMLREAGLCAEGRVLVGDPRDALVLAAKEERVELLVLGSHGRTGLTRLLLGSVSSHAVNHAPCSVLVVKDVVGR